MSTEQLAQDIFARFAVANLGGEPQDFANLARKAVMVAKIFSEVWPVAKDLPVEVYE